MNLTRKMNGRYFAAFVDNHYFNRLFAAADKECSRTFYKMGIPLKIRL